MTPNDRFNAVTETRQRLVELQQCFNIYFRAYRDYRDALKKQHPMEIIVAETEVMDAAKTKVREVFRAVEEHLRAGKDTFAGDAIAEVYASVLDQIDRWNRDKLKSKYAQFWCEAFANRFAEVAKIGGNLNRSKPRQAQVRSIAKSDWPVLRSVNYDDPTPHSLG